MVALRIIRRHCDSMTDSVSDENEVGPLSIADWDFSQVPSDELIACCLWEYARESASIGISAEYHRILMRRITGNATWGGLPASESEFRRHVSIIDDQAKSLGYDSESFLGRYWASDHAYVKFYETLRECVSPDSTAWQNLPADLRRKFVQELNERPVIQEISQSLVGELEQLWRENSGSLEEVRSKPRPTNDDSEDFELFSESSTFALPEEDPRQEPRKIAVAFTVDFSRFTDRDIMNKFSDWLRANRPKPWHRPMNSLPVVAQGRKLNDFRVALERLGIMRLLHWYSPGDLKSQLPGAWRIYRGKEPVFRREVRAAERFFRQIFPFLPEGERPLSIERCRVRMRRFAEGLEEANGS